jgi:hypothetical protein
MDTCGVDLGVIAAGIASEETGPVLHDGASRPDRLRVASDHPFLPMDRAVAAAPDLPLSDTAARAFLGGTAARLLHLGELGAAPTACTRRRAARVRCNRGPRPHRRLVERLVA